MISDSEITEVFRKSENEGIRKLIDSYSNYIYTIITEKLSGLASENDKEECAADIIFETLKVCREQNFEIESYKAVISVIAKRKAIDLFRKLQYKDEHSEYLDEISTEPAVNETPESSVVTKHERDYLWNEVLKLGKPDSDILIFQFFYRKTAAEIAELLKTTVTAVNKRSQRARKKLKKILEAKEAF
ncbi:MAG: sigma-70 family RNA polymerase sigma factor [Oscillospiraceae bacterium]|nr:sigma-70 family RNA polymerase sigma factor [Oscillospiraceae bacterium]